MATRSSISIKTPEGKYRSVYCHWDGYPSHNGRILKEHYTNVDKINRLIDLGDLSSLNERVDPVGEHSYDDKEPGVVVAYGRDRGETDVGFTLLEDLKSVKKRYDDCDYHYVYDGSWKIIRGNELVDFDVNED